MLAIFQCLSYNIIMATILLVDDFEQLSLVVGSFLKHADHKVTTAPNGAEALKHFDEHFFDLLITDLWMPEMNGVDLIRAVKERRPQTRVLAITGAKGGDAGPKLAEAREAGADATLQKPFGRKEMMAEINRLLPPRSKPAFRPAP
jgi:DNA-binding response OmpR family regulator